MPINRFGHVSGTLRSFVATRVSTTPGSYVDGIYQSGTESTTTHDVNCQPATDRQIEQLSAAGRRINDTRRLYINDGVLASISPADDWIFEGARWECIQMDNRPWRNYCRVYVSRYDNQGNA